MRPQVDVNEATIYLCKRPLQQHTAPSQWYTADAHAKLDGIRNEIFNEYLEFILSFNKTSFSHANGPTA